MHQKNFEYLRDQIKFTGFGDGLEEKLRTAMTQGRPTFKLKHFTQYGENLVMTELNFSQSKQSNLYFFNSYQVNLQKEGTIEKMRQQFFIHKDHNITLKEAYNLMSGRAVNKDLTNKEGHVFNAWIQMDFKQSNENGNYKLKYFNQNYGFDLEASLAKHPIRELTNETFKNNLIESLKRGNLQSVTFLKEGGEQKLFIEASPQFKTIHIYDSNGQRLDNRQGQVEKQAEGEKKTHQQNSKTEKLSGSDDISPEIPPATKRKHRKQSQSL